MRDGRDRRDRRVVEVPADVAALSPAARDLLCARLAWRCGVHEVRIGAGADPVITFEGPRGLEVTDEFRALADAAILSVSADAAAGWTAKDERERHGPASWG
ncbi:hypothetical protein AB0L40_03185 [Patulibacter sp. NPDC049589]|uniref:hypothetical protein n=1 Tax=Patulibacter sp. NPDC049589 TaxID=3154731 RepID=UPI00343DA373